MENKYRCAGSYCTEMVEGRYKFCRDCALRAIQETMRGYIWEIQKNRMDHDITPLVKPHQDFNAVLDILTRNPVFVYNKFFMHKDVWDHILAVYSPWYIM